MSQERWDVVLRFLGGALAYQGDMVLRGPVVRIGANPGPGGLRLEGYRALDDRHAVITAYDGGTASIAPVGPNQVRMAPHEHVDWKEIQPVRGPVFLSPGCAVHMGPPGRGATAVFVECRRLGVWEQRAILSDSSQGEDDEDKGSQVRELDITKRIPWWFLPSIAFMLMSTFAAVGLVVLVLSQRQVERLGPVDEGQEYYDYGDVFAITEVNTTLYQGLTQGYYNFVMKPGIDAGKLKGFEKPESWDKVLMQWVTRSEQMYIKGWAFWVQLDNHKDDYALVLHELRAAGLPDVLAAVPFQESRYKADAWDTMLCAAGWWQFQPEVAFRNNLDVRDCHFRGSSTLWSPKKKAAPRNAIKNADYVSNQSCVIPKGGCEIDQRMDKFNSTKAAVNAFKVPFADPDLRNSGALVALTIASHNAGFDDSPYREGQISRTNIKIAYANYLADTKQERAPDFIGQNIKCATKDDMSRLNADNINASCGSYLANVTQTYTPYVIAQHLLAVCYYGLNYAGTNPEFEPYSQYVIGNGYCKDIAVPNVEQVQKHGAGK